MLSEIIHTSMNNLWYNISMVRSWYVVTTIQAGDIDELLNPGYPVYFNFTNVYAELIPKSLKVAEQSANNKFTTIIVIIKPT